MTRVRRIIATAQAVFVATLAACLVSYSVTKCSRDDREISAPASAISAAADAIDFTQPVPEIPAAYRQ